MAELVIKIDDETYKQSINRTEFDTLVLGIKLIEAVQNGTLLPKGHGRLIDADKLLDENIDTFMLQTETKIRIAPTIIEADKESKEWQQ